jgi:hypothetical protein
MTAILATFVPVKTLPILADRGQRGEGGGEPNNNSIKALSFSNILSPWGGDDKDFSWISCSSPEPEFLNWAQESIPSNQVARLCSLAGRYDNPVPTRFLVPIDCLKIPALDDFIYASSAVYLSSQCRSRICKPFKEPRNRFPGWRAGTTTLFDVPARQGYIG